MQRVTSYRYNRQALRSVVTGVAILLLPSCLFAHPGHGATNGFAHGFLHPLSGLDHLCAMIAVGLWAARRDRRIRWAAPVTFIAMTAIGGLLAWAGVAASFVEEGIIASVLILGVMIATAVRPTSVIGILTIGLFALLHGNAHVAEMPAAASILSYASGFVVSTLVLHVGGIALAMSLHRLEKGMLIRYAGLGIAAIGIALWAAA